MKTFRPCSPLAASSLHPRPHLLTPSPSQGEGAKQECRPARRHRRRRGALLVEVLAAALILTFLVGATAQFFKVGNGQQRLGASYSQVETNLRTALRLMTRTIRHGYNVVSSVSSGNLNGKSSSTTQIIVN